MSRSAFFAVLAGLACHAPEGSTDADPTPGTTPNSTDTPPVETDTETGTDTNPDVDPLTGAAFADCTTEAPWWRDEGTLTAVFVDPAASPNAVCNDGSPGLYYVRPGDSNWLIYLDGGSQCNNHGNCLARWCDVGDSYDHTDMSSEGAPTHNDLGGLFSEVEANPFSTWTHVYIHYCSSDLWTGAASDAATLVDTGDAGDTTDYAIRFNGHDIVHAVFDELLAPTRRSELATLPPAADMQRILFAGGSAGGLGVIWNGDSVATRIRSVAPTADVRLGVVAGIAMGLQGATDPWGPIAAPEAFVLSIQGMYGLGTTAADVFSKAKYDGFLDESCQAAHPDDGWWCADAVHVLSHQVETPFFVAQDQLDPVWFTSLDTIIDGHDGPDNGLMTSAFQEEATRDLVTSFASIEDPATPSAYLDGGVPVGWYMPRCAEHDGYGRNNDLFLGYDVDTSNGPPDVASFAALLAAWTADAAPTRGLTSPSDLPDCSAP